jgi:hypothetical protein
MTKKQKNKTKDHTVEELEELACVMKKFTHEYMDCFNVIFKKHMKIDGKTSIIAAFSSITNCLMKLVTHLSAKEIVELNIDFVGIVNRFAESLKKCENKWGKISGKKFDEEFSKEYEKTQRKYFGRDDKDMEIIQTCLNKAYQKKI